MALPQMPTSHPETFLRGPLLLLLLAIGLVSQPVPAWAQPFREGDLAADEERFIRLLIFDYKYTHLAHLWIDTRMKNASQGAKGDLQYFKADVYQVEGEFEKMNALLGRLPALFPGNPRGAEGVLKTIQSRLAAVVTTHGEALEAAADPERQKHLLRQRDEDFQSEVIQPLSSAIEKKNAAIAPMPKPPPALLDSRDEWEQYRVRAWKLYADLLEPGTPEAKTAFTKTLELGTTFVQERFQNEGLAYETQLLVAEALGALGRPEEAAEAFDLVTEVLPPMDPPYSAGTVTAFRRLRNQGVLGTAQAWNRSGRPERAVEVFDYVRSSPHRYFPYRMDPEDPSLQPIMVLADIEEGIARLAGGNGAEGLKLFRQLIDTFGSERYRQIDPEGASSYLFEVARGLSRLLEMQVGALPAELNYRAGIGFKSRGHLEDAIQAWKRALYAGRGIETDSAWCRRALYEIGDTSAFLGRNREAALSFLILLEMYPEGENLPFAAQNAYSYAADLASAEGGAWSEVTRSALEYFNRFGKGTAAEQQKLNKATELEGQGQYVQAQRLYLGVSEELQEDGKVVEVPFYYRAQAAAARCLFRLGVSAGDAGKHRDEAIAALEALDGRARKAASDSGRAAILYELAEIYWLESDRDPQKTAAVLAPLDTEVGGDSEVRSAGLHRRIQALLAQKKVAEAERVFEFLRADFARERSTAYAISDLLDAHREAGTPPDRKRAAQLAELYAAHPVVNLQEQGVEGQLWIAIIMIEGGEHDKAATVLEAARARASTLADPALERALQLTFAMAATASGRPREALDSLEVLMGKYGPQIENGELGDADEILIQLARARLALHNKTPNAAILKEAEQSLRQAEAILYQRRLGARRRGTWPMADEIKYWNTILQRLKIAEATKRCEEVVLEITGLRVQTGNKPFAPGDLQREFDELEERCKGKK